MKLLSPEHHLEEEKDFLKGNDVGVDDDISHGGDSDGDTNGEKEERGEDATPLSTPCACSTLEVCRKVRSRFQAFALVNRQCCVLMIFMVTMTITMINCASYDFGSIAENKTTFSLISSCSLARAVTNLDRA